MNLGALFRRTARANPWDHAAFERALHHRSTSPVLAGFVLGMRDTVRHDIDVNVLGNTSTTQAIEDRRVLLMLEALQQSAVVFLTQNHLLDVTAHVGSDPREISLALAFLPRDMTGTQWQLTRLENLYISFHQISLSRSDMIEVGRIGAGILQHFGNAEDTLMLFEEMRSIK